MLSPCGCTSCNNFNDVNVVTVRGLELSYYKAWKKIHNHVHQIPLFHKVNVRFQLYSPKTLELRSKKLKIRSCSREVNEHYPIERPLTVLVLYP